MEYRIWNILKKKMPVIVLISVAAAVIALVIAKQAAPGYQVHYSYLVSLSTRDQASDFRFDGYYALQATDLFASTLAKWIETPEVIVAAYEEAGLPIPSSDPGALTRSVRAEKAAAQLVTVTVRTSQQETAHKLAEGLQVVMQENIEKYHAEGVPAVSFNVVATQPWAGVIRLSIPVVITATFIFTFFVVLNVMLLLESRKNNENRR